MAYRDEVTAALARAESAERRAAELQSLLDQRTARHPDKDAIPPRFRLRRSFGLTEVTWSERFKWGHLFFTALLAVCILLAATQNREDGIAFCAVAIIYYLPSLVASSLNHSTLRVTSSELVLRRGPVYRRRIAVPASAITQAYCRGEDDVWSVEVAHGETYVEIARDLRRSEALFLEHAIEKELAIEDHAHERETTPKETA